MGDRGKLNDCSKTNTLGWKRRGDVCKVNEESVPVDLLLLESENEEPKRSGNGSFTDGSQ